MTITVKSAILKTIVIIIFRIINFYKKSGDVKKLKKYSMQREALLTELNKRKDHPTAEDIYLSLRKNFPNYSLGTVYRNLGDLCKEGYILKIASGMGPDRYDGCIKPHGHFMCKKCGKVYDIEGFYEKYIDSDAIINETEKAGVCHNIACINEIQVMLCGVCGECMNNIED